MEKCVCFFVLLVFSSNDDDIFALKANPVVLDLVFYHLSIHPSNHSFISLYQSRCSFIHPSYRPYSSPSIQQSIHSSIHPIIYIYLNQSMFIHPSIHHSSINSSLHQSIHPIIYLFINPSVRSFIHSFINPSIIHLFIQLFI